MPVIGNPVAVTDVTVVDPDSHRLAEPGPFVPKERKYAVALASVVQLKVTADPGRVDPGIGLVSAASGESRFSV